MKKTFPIIIFIVVLIGAGLWWKKNHTAAPGAAAAADKPVEEEGTKLTHDTNGNIVVQISDEAQGDAGIQVSNPTAAQFNPEIKGYGRVLDPGPLNSALNELLAARVALDYSHHELERMKTLKEQNNTSERAFQTAEETDARNQAALSGLLAKIQPVWGNVLFQRLVTYAKPGVKSRTEDPLLEGLVGFKSALIRVDLPAGEILEAGTFQQARVVPLGENAKQGQAEYFDIAPTVDPQTQGRGVFFLVSDNKNNLRPGMALTAYIQLSGPPLEGIEIPREAVVRTEGSAWVYVMNEGAGAFTRVPVVLERPTEKGWFIAKGIKASNYLVTSGAQALLSEELKGLIKVD